MVGGWCLCGSNLHDMPGTDTDDIMCGINVVNIVSVKQKILLTGTCWYELTGLWNLLTEQGYDVHRVPLGYSCARHGWDLIIVALSAEPVAGWGRLFPQIREIRSQMSGKMITLVPERLKKMKVLFDVCLVYSGHVSLQQLNDYISAILRCEITLRGRFRLTDGQRRVLRYLGEKDDALSSLKREKHNPYYHYSRLVENVGVRDLRLLLMAGLDREIEYIINKSFKEKI